MNFIEDGDDIIKAASGRIPDTDDADSRTVLEVLRFCACAWVPEARLVGNVRAGDIARATTAVLDELDEARAEIARLREQMRSP